MSSLLDVLTTPLRFALDVQRVAHAIAQMPALGFAITGLHTELAGLRADLKSMPADSRRLADDVEIVHRDLDVMKTALAQTNLRVAPVHEDLLRVEAGLAPLPDALHALLPKIDEVGGRLELLRGELTEHLDGLRNDLSGLPFVSKTPRPSGVGRAA